MRLSNSKLNKYIASAKLEILGKLANQEMLTAEEENILLAQLSILEDIEKICEERKRY